MAGACYGVERALEMTEDALKDGAFRVRTLGPLIHNPRVVASLAERGAAVVEDPRDAAGCTLVLRTHGVTPAEEARGRELCSSVVDATCPFVKKVHRAAEQLSAEGYRVVIVGEAGHPEVTATLAHAPGAVVVGTAEGGACTPACAQDRRCGADHAVCGTLSRGRLGTAVAHRGASRVQHHLRGPYLGAPGRLRRARRASGCDGGHRRSELCQHHAPGRDCS